MNVGRLTVMLIIGASPVVFSATANSQGIQVLDGRLPSVYLKYESTPQSPKSTTVTLQLHNNMNININVAANFRADLAHEIEDGGFETIGGGGGTFLRSGSLVELCYDAEVFVRQDAYGKLSKIRKPEVTNVRYSCSFRSSGKGVDAPYGIGYWIRPKQFVRFQIPRDLLRENVKVYTEFRLPWEFENGRISFNAPKHRVYFFYSDLPQ